MLPMDEKRYTSIKQLFIVVYSIIACTALKFAFCEASVVCSSSEVHVSHAISNIDFECFMRTSLL